MAACTAGRRGWGKGEVPAVASVSCLAILLLKFADKLCRPVIRSDQLTKLYFITNPTDLNFLALTLTTTITNSVL